MHTNVPLPGRRSRRLGTLATAVGVVSALTLVSAPAHAADPAVHYQVIASTVFDADSDCTLTDEGSDSNDDQTITTTGTKKVALSNSTSATATNTMDPTDTATFSAKSTLTGTVVAKSGAFTSLALKGSMSAKSSAKQGFDSDCDPEAGAYEGILIALVVKKTGWLKLASSNGRGVVTQLMLAAPTAGGVQMISIGNKASQVVKRKVTPGLYQLTVQHQLVDLGHEPGAPISASGTSSLSVVYSTTKP